MNKKCVLCGATFVEAGGFARTSPKGQPFEGRCILGCGVRDEDGETALIAAIEMG